MQRLITKKNSFILLMALALIPLFFVNVKSSHDWGGDFAMYIMQAKNIVKGEPQGDTPYLYNPGNAVLGPPAYPAGFPLLLSPVAAMAGNSVFAFSLYITAFLFGTALMMALVLRRYFSELVVFFLLMAMAYNPWTLAMKLEIMSEFPFTFLLLLCFYLFEKYAKGPFWMGIVIAILGGLLMSVRVIGVVFPLAVLVWAVRKRFIERDRSPVNKCVCGFLVSVGSILFYLLLNNVIFHIPQAEGGSYTGIWGAESLDVTLLSNLAYYTEQFKYYFSPWGGAWNFLPLMIKSVVFTFTLVGLLKSLLRRWELMDMIVVLYLGVLLVYPYRHAGIRFLFPLMPFLMYYLVTGLQSLSLFEAIRRNVKISVLGVLLLSSYLIPMQNILRMQDKTVAGPQEEQALQAWEYIRANTDEDAVILFSKPRVLALYTGRKSLANHKADDPAAIQALIRDYDVDYILLHTDLAGPAIKNFVAAVKDILPEQWHNEHFRLLRIDFEGIDTERLNEQNN